MKTEFKIFNVLVWVAVFSLTGCNGNTQSSDQTGQVEPPAIDFNMAAVTGDLEAVRQHIAAGSDLNEKEPMGGSTPLISAIVFGKTEVAKLLIEAGTDLDIQNNDGSSALHCAAFFCHPELVEVLLQAGADATLKNNYGVTAYETVLGPWEAILPAYEMQQAMLGGFGLVLDFDRIERTRAEVAELLK